MFASLGDICSEFQLGRDSAKYAKLAAKSLADVTCSLLTNTGDSYSEFGMRCNYTKYAKIADDYATDTSFLLAIICDICSESQMGRDSAKYAKFVERSLADGPCSLSTITGGTCGESGSRSTYTKYATIADDYGAGTCLFAMTCDTGSELQLRRDSAKYAKVAGKSLAVITFFNSR